MGHYSGHTGHIPRQRIETDANERPLSRTPIRQFHHASPTVSIKHGLPETFLALQPSQLPQLQKPPTLRKMVQPSEPEFEQARNELATTIAPFLERHPEYKAALEIVQIPERIVQFRVVWEDDQGKPHVNSGYRVQFNSTLGPYKGGLRLHPSVNLSILKFLGFEQVRSHFTSLNE